MDSSRFDLQHVNSTRHLLEGTDQRGEVIRVSGNFHYNGPTHSFGGMITTPESLSGQSCTTVIDDTHAVLTITRRFDPEHYAIAMMMD
ncbi:MAG: hypothetical protein ACI9H6_000680 [Patiriisocius sp.]|jgi:hypothetical protein